MLINLQLDTSLFDFALRRHGLLLTEYRCAKSDQVACRYRSELSVVRRSRPNQSLLSNIALGSDVRGSDAPFREHS
jgi:hypothetical protein